MFFLILVLVLCDQINAATFNLQYLGDTLSIEEANARDLCFNKYCVNDAELLFTAATQNSSVDPCTDFKEFAVGTFSKYAALNERYQGRGFYNDVRASYRERQRKLLASKININDSRVFKILKNFFQKCVNSSECSIRLRGLLLKY